MAVLSMIGRIFRTRAVLLRPTGWLCGLVLLLAVAPEAKAQPAPTAEYQLKAVFLFNFAQFVEWPARAFPSPTTPLVIGVLGEDPFGSYLDDLVRDEKIGSHPLVVRRITRAEDITACHIVFICRSEAHDLGGIIARLKRSSVLTVSDVDTFIRQGGMVRFLMENGKIRLRINVKAAKACDLTVSSKILRPGTVADAGTD
jgi:hypothetical protein